MYGSLFPLLLSLSCAVLILGSNCVAENSFILGFCKLVVSPFGGMLSSLMLGLGMLQRMWWMDTWSCSFNSWGLTNCNHCDMGKVDQIYCVLFAGVLCWCSSQYCVWRCDQELCTKMGWGKKISQDALFYILEALCKLEGHEVLFLRFPRRQRSLCEKRAATPMNVYLKGMPQ
jgi:hypothetical protein